MKLDRSSLKPKYIFLIFSVIEFALWLVVKSSNAFMYLTLPVATVLFGLFLICQMLEGETALDDQEQRAAIKIAAPPSAESSHAALRRTQ